MAVSRVRSIPRALCTQLAGRWIQHDHATAANSREKDSKKFSDLMRARRHTHVVSCLVAWPLTPQAIATRQAAAITSVMVAHSSLLQQLLSR